jgi:ParD-like antitoxin of type II ParDE toxin-antitoxin system
MPSLNITFTDEELEEVRAAAAAEGKSLKQYVHDLSLRERQRQLFVRTAVEWGQQHLAEFDEAFPDEVPPADRYQGAAAA